jgi:phosphoribosyl 1,2-cyclic phosphodiesterase
LEPLIINLLGTGGGRFAMTTQRRRTAGIHLNHGVTNIHLDPGPGALVFSNWAKLNLQKLDALIVSHCHPDHYSDAEVFIEAMTSGTTKSHGILAATDSVLYGFKGIGPSISEYHKNLPLKIISLKQDTEFNVNSLKVKAIEAQHSDPTSVGLRFKVPNIGDIGYTGDTGYFPKLPIRYEGCTLLILCVIWPRGNPLKKHLCTDDAIMILRQAKPKAAVITHFGIKMINADPEKEARYLEKETGIPIIAAIDGMKIKIDEHITFKGPRKKDEERNVII